MANRYPQDPDDNLAWRRDEELAQRRRMDESERNYSSDRPYGDRDYGWRSIGPETWRGEYRDPAQRPSPEGWRSEHRHESSFTGGYRQSDYSASATGSDSWRVPGPFAGRGPRGYQRPDDRIREEVNDRLTAHGLIDATDVECRVEHGEVTLTGFVNSRQAKRAAEDVIEDIHGVRDIHNQLRVRSHADDAGVGRTSVLGLTESQLETPPAGNTTTGLSRSRTRS